MTLLHCLQIAGLDDLCVRFIINLPHEELESVERICFQIEEAQWFYEDFVRPLDPNLPSLNLRQFCLKIFQHCPLFSSYDSVVHSNAFSEFLAYKTRVPVRGAILLNEAMTEVVLVKGWKKGANWSFPRGKINKDEKDIDCAIREVYEETGYDVRAAGLVSEETARYIEVTMREQHMMLFVVAGVPMDTYFEPRTRKEISRIQWYKLSELPTAKKLRQQQHQQDPQGEHVGANKFYMVAPFLSPLRKIISQLRKVSGRLNATVVSETPVIQETVVEPETVQDIGSAVPTETDKMQALVAKLRQSKEVTEQHSLPEEPVSSEKQSSIRLDNLLNMKPDPPSHQSVPTSSDGTTAVRENKAQAILSLLRSRSKGAPQENTVQAYPQAPNVTRHDMSVTNGPVLQSFANPPPAVSPHLAMGSHSLNRAERHLGVPPSELGQQTLSKGNTEKHTRRLEEMPQINRPFVPTAPFHHTDDFSLAQRPRPLGNSSGVTAPAARQLAPPKLTAHSSALLSLFKSSPPASSNTAPSGEPQMPVEKGSNPVEFPATGTPPAFAAALQGRNGSGTALRASRVAVDVNTARPSQQLPNDRTTHQNALLNIFKSAAAPRPSPSLLHSPAPVELSASASGKDTKQNQEGKGLAPSTNVPAHLVPGQVKIAKRPAQAADRRSEKERQQTSSPSREASKPVKILPRPGSTTDGDLGSKSVKNRPGVPPGESPSRTRRENSAGRSTSTFQPTILKRPASSSLHPHSPDPFPNMGSQTQSRDRGSDAARAKPPLSILARPTAPTADGQRYGTGHAATDLQANPNDIVSPADAASLFNARMSVGNIDGVASSVPQPLPRGVSPVDDSLLLEFLGEVARGGK